MVTARDVQLSDGRVLHAYDATDGQTRPLTVVWHHGTPNIGSPPAPLFAAADRLGIRWLSYDRPGYGCSTARPGRDVASASADVAAIADAFLVDHFAVMGHSGGGPHALACAALAPERVMAAVSISGLAPYGAPDLDWFAGMAPSGQAALRAAAAGRATKIAFETSGEEQDFAINERDLAALSGDWAWLNTVVGPALAGGPDPLIDDDLAYTSPWGFDPTAIAAPVLFLHGDDDAIVPLAHSEWLAARCPSATLRVGAGDGHISVLAGAEAAMAWLHDVA